MPNTQTSLRALRPSRALRANRQHQRLHLRRRFWALALTAAGLATLPAISHAVDGVTDRAGDFLPTFGGTAASTDLDVLSATVLYDASTDMFRLTGTMAGPIGLTLNNLYVWGANRGAGVASFAANGINGVRFDRVITLRSDGTGTVAGVGNLPAGAVTISGNTISAVVSGASLTSTGFNKIDYTWNLWPRDTTFAGFAAIADFAPDNANFTSTPGLVPVPEPATAALMLAGVLGIAAAARRRARPDIRA